MVEMWLARNGNAGKHSSYVLGTDSFTWDEDFRNWFAGGWKDATEECCFGPGRFERMFPDLKLEPGQEPIRVNVTIEAAKKESKA